MSLPVRGAWIEIAQKALEAAGTQSLPVRGAWIEIPSVTASTKLPSSLPVRGAWIEIFPFSIPPVNQSCRSPCGERGLKYYIVDAAELEALSLPVRGAWIEIRQKRQRPARASRSLPVRGAWIEISPAGEASSGRCTSLPVRGAWIEMILPAAPWICPTGRSPCGERGLKYRCLPTRRGIAQVAPRAGSVD